MYPSMNFNDMKQYVPVPHKEPVCTLVSPSGNKEVWKESDKDRKLAEGYKTLEEMKAIWDEQARVAHEEWLTSPDTVEERANYIRIMRNGKLDEYDKYIAQLEREQRYAEVYSVESQAVRARSINLLNDIQRELDEYAKALCDITQQEGFPWDGGGEATPWPELPKKAIEEMKNASKR